MTGKSTLRLSAILLALAAAEGAVGCGDGVSPPASPVVTADSDEGKQAQAEDAALRALRRQQEAKAASRKRGLKLPPET